MGVAERCAICLVLVLLILLQFTQQGKSGRIPTESPVLRCTTGNVSVASSVLRDAANPLVTTTIVSCNRLPQIIRTLDAFFRTIWEHRELFKPVVVLMDCYNATFEKVLRHRYTRNQVTLTNSSFVNRENTGNEELQPATKALWNQAQALEDHVATPYWFAMEDDWEFVSPGFVPLSIKLFEENHHETQNHSVPFWAVMGRGADTFFPKTNRTAPMILVRNEDDPHYGNTTFKAWPLAQNSGGGGLFGCWTANPCLYRASQAREFFKSARSFGPEGQFSKHLCMEKGVSSRVYIYEHVFYEHIGADVSTMGTGNAWYTFKGSRHRPAFV